ncbi:hypothetical protein [Ruminococcus albus]|uniref:Uncharacterized protein n=1 Tax=Ruminococcus albus TaxID=1264 RepID=A0A1H7GZR3_RUMAL|nr:hypothetical protein [Ruminococcus albus]SEK41375.1 hypothetical protein SAMN05216469_102257 [Ruminococcus albus]
MPRKITTKEWKNRRDFNAWKIELDDYSMSDIHAKYDEAVAVLKKREEQRIGVLKDTLWKAMVQFVGVNITPDELEDAVGKIMNSKFNEDIIFELMAREEQRVKEIEAEEAARLEELRGKHVKLVNNLSKAKSNAEKAKKAEEEDSDDNENEDFTAEGSAASVSEDDTEEYLTDPVELDSKPEDIITEDPET